jgi:hypothetical protein
MLQRCFSQKMETFSPLGNASNGESGKVHLAICKEKINFDGNFSDLRRLIPIIPLKSLQMILEAFRINHPPPTRNTAYN